MAPHSTLSPTTAEAPEPQSEPQPQPQPQSQSPEQDRSSPPALLADLTQHGFIILRSVLPAEELETLRGAASRLTALARAGSWPHVRTVGKQFPPWPTMTTTTTTGGTAGIWGVQHLLHPDLPVSSADRAAFARLYFSDAVLGPARSLLSSPPSACTDDQLVMELCNMLVRPETDFSLRWHRDDVPATATSEEEAARLAEPAWHAQWNLALCDDDESLVLVPGSHARPRSGAERAAGPYDSGLPGETRVKLGAGDVAFYDNNIWHRGVYDSTRERMTLHGSVGHVRGSKARARNVLQHGVGEWVSRCDFSELLAGADEKVRRRAEGMRERLVRMGRESGEVGYSLSG